MTTAQPAADFWASLSIDQQDAEDQQATPDEQEQQATPDEQAAADTTAMTEQAQPTTQETAEEGPAAQPPSDWYESAKRAGASGVPTDLRVFPPAPPSPPEPETIEEEPVAVEAIRPYSPVAADLSWVTAERIAEPLAAGFAMSPAGESTAWLDLLTQRAEGDRDMAGRAYDVLTGWHLLGELWRDERVNEIHIRGTQVTVSGTHGVHEMPGFHDPAAARRAVEAVTGAQAAPDMTVSRIGESVILSRPQRTRPTAADLVADEIISATMLSVVELALARTQSVTVTGAAAPAVMRALASLIPPGSRIFEGPLGVLPPGCVTTASPLDADYVIGVRPGGVAEEMAAEGQIGALIANPKTPFKAVVQLTVSGRTAALGRVTSL
jgi:hypothetical protein